MALFLCKFTAACLNALQLKKLDFKWQLFFFTFRVNCYKPTFILFAFKLRDDTSLITLRIWSEKLCSLFCLLMLDSELQSNRLQSFRSKLSNKDDFSTFFWNFDFQAIVQNQSQLLYYLATNKGQHGQCSKYP